MESDNLQKTSKDDSKKASLENYETLSLISSFKSEESERLLVSLDEMRISDSMTCFGLFAMPMFAKYPYVFLFLFYFFFDL